MVARLGFAHPLIGARDEISRAAEELEDDNLTILDFENIILTGAIVERQRDRQTREVKYIVRGNTLSSVLTEAVVKIAPDGNLFVITVYPV